MQKGEVCSVSALQSALAQFMGDIQRLLFEPVGTAIGNKAVLCLSKGFEYRLVEIEAVGYIKLQIFPTVWAQYPDNYIYCRVQPVGGEWWVIEGDFIAPDVFGKAPEVGYGCFREWTPLSGFGAAVPFSRIAMGY